MSGVRAVAAFWLVAAAFAGVGLVVAPWPVLGAVGFGLLAVSATAAVRSMRRRGAPTDPVLPEVVLLPLALAAPRSTAVAVVAVAALAVWSRLHRKRRPVGTPFWLAVASGMVVVTLGDLDTRLLLIAGAAYIAIRSERERVQASFVDGLGLYLLANVAGHLAGLHSPVEGARIAFGTSSGLFDQRIAFPFATSLVTPPVIAGAYIAGVLPLLVTSRDRRGFRAAALLAGLVVLLGANYRVPLVAAAMLSVAALTARRRLVQWAPAVALALLLLPFGWGAVERPVTAALDTAAHVIPSLERSGEQTSTLSNRTTIWKVTRQRQAEQPMERRMFGWGPNGQVPSGVSRGYAYLLRKGFANPLSAGSHSTALQQLVDGGLVGLGLLAAALATTLRGLRRWRGVHGLSCISMVLAVTVSAGTESVLAPGTNVVGFSVLLVASSLGAKKAAPRRGRPSPDAMRSHTRLSDTPNSAASFASVSAPFDASRSILIPRI